MYSLIYRSKASPEIGASDIRSILETAHQRNPDRGVTGVLLMRDREFIQYLECDSRQALDDLYTRISKDPRHTDVEQLDMIPIRERLFDGWAMAYRNLDDHTGIKGSGEQSMEEAIAGILGVDAANAPAMILQAIARTLH